MRGRLALLVLVALVAYGLAVPAPASALTPSGDRDVATASAYIPQTLGGADAVAGPLENNLAIRYTAGRSLSDGTVRIVFPRGLWPTPLYPSGGYLETGSGQAGAFSVRPAPPDIVDPTIPPGMACGWPATEPLTSSVDTVLGSQVIVIQHANCATGQELLVRVKNIAAPPTPGRYYLPVLASDSTGGWRLSAASIDVLPTPRVTLHLTVPNQVTAAVPFLVQVEALRDDGQVATGYRGAVSLVSLDTPDCTLVPADGTIAHQFTAADAGVYILPVSLSLNVAHRLRAYDVANQALPGDSNPFVVTGFYPYPQCPVSYY